MTSTYAEQVFKIVNDAFSLDMVVKTRKREYVDARMTCAYILTNSGMTSTSVGRLLGKDHATILHYKSKFPFIMKQDANLKAKYEYVMANVSPPEQVPDVYFYSKYDLIQEVLSLRLKVSDLNSQKDRLLSDNVRLKRVDDSLAPLYKILRERTHSGNRAKVERSLTTFFNGLR